MLASPDPVAADEETAGMEERKFGKLWKGSKLLGGKIGKIDIDYKNDADNGDKDDGNKQYYKEKAPGDLITICSLEPHPSYVATFPIKAKLLPTDGVCIAGEKVMMNNGAAPPREMNGAKKDGFVCGDRCDRWCGIIKKVPAAACLRPSNKYECEDDGFCCVCANPDQSGWFVGQDVEDRVDYEDCNEACARYTTVIQAAGFHGKLVCNDKSIDKMSNVLNESHMIAALEAKSDFSDDFPINNAIMSVTLDNRASVGSTSPYFSSDPAMSMTGEARFVPDLGSRVHAKCDNAFANKDPSVNRYCFCDYID